MGLQVRVLLSLEQSVLFDGQRNFQCFVGREGKDKAFSTASASLFQDGSMILDPCHPPLPPGHAQKESGMKE